MLQQWKTFCQYVEYFVAMKGNKEIIADAFVTQITNKKVTKGMQHARVNGFLELINVEWNIVSCFITDYSMNRTPFENDHVRSVPCHSAATITTDEANAKYERNNSRRID